MHHSWVNLWLRKYFAFGTNLSLKFKVFYAAGHRFLGAFMPLSLICVIKNTLYLCIVRLYRERKIEAEIGITVIHLHQHTMGPCVGFPIVLWWYFQLPHFILPLLNGNNDTQLFYSFHLDCETGGWWYISWQPVWQWPQKKTRFEYSYQTDDNLDR